MKPLRVSTSKSCAAKVVVSTVPVDVSTLISGRGSDKKWSGGRECMKLRSVDMVASFEGKGLRFNI